MDIETCNKDFEVLICVPGSIWGREITLNDLLIRKKQQLATRGKFDVYHDFRFENEVDKTRITFQHIPVDDTTTEFRFVHYQHGNGVAAADVDNDGLGDIYFVTQAGRNELWKNLGDGTFRNITDSAGVDVADKISIAASFADIDNDGDQDLYVTTVRMGNVLLENQGDGTFKDISQTSGLDYAGHSSSSIFFDYDRDGLLDVYLTNIGSYTTDETATDGHYIGRKDGYLGPMFPDRIERSLLFKNLGGNKFADVTAEAKTENITWAGAVTVADLNSDHYPDLLVLNMGGDDHYYENHAGEYFVDKTLEYFGKTPYGSMDAKFFDYNNDGLLDLYITDMHSDMLKESPEFSVTAEKTKVSVAGMSMDEDHPMVVLSKSVIFGNGFYENQGNGRFTEISDSIGGESHWPWGVSVADLNADGYDDIFVTASMNWPYRYAVNSVLLNNRGETFLDSEFILGVEPRKDGIVEKDWFTLNCDGVDRSHFECVGKSGSITVKGAVGSRSSVVIDLEDDGDLDIVTNEYHDRPQVFLSNLSDQKDINFIKLSLVGARSNKNALGATVSVYTKSSKYTRYNDGKSGYFSQSQLPLYFGLGESREIEKIEITWPSGLRQTITKDIPLNSVFTISEP